jgi:O-antigen/teichoic acid export membrane protein
MGAMTPGADAAARTTGASVMRGGAWTALSHVVPQLYTLAVSIAAARFLGPADFGRLSFITFVASSVLLVLTSGPALALMRAVAESAGARRDDVARGLTAWAWRANAIAALLGGGGLVVAAIFGSRPQLAWALAGLFAALGVLQSVGNAVLLGVQRFRAAALIGLMTGGATVPVTIAVLAAGGGIAGVFAVESAVVAANFFWTALLARRALRATGTDHSLPRELKRSVAKFAGWTTLGALITLVVWKRSEFVFLAHYADDVEIGLYSIAFALVTAIATLPERLSSVLVSAFATLRGAGADERIRWGYSRSLRLLVSVSFPLTAGALAVGPALIRAVYGADYHRAGEALMIMVAVIPFLAVSSIASSLMSGLDDARTPLLAGVFAAVLNIALAFALVPPFEALGAAGANTGAQIAATGALYVGARRYAGGADWRPAELARCALASAACALAAVGVLALLDGVLGVLAAIAAGAVVFLALALVIRPLSADDATWLDGHLGAVAGGWAGRVIRRAGGVK